MVALNVLSAIIYRVFNFQVRSLTHTFIDFNYKNQKLKIFLNIIFSRKWIKFQQSLSLFMLL